MRNTKFKHRIQYPEPGKFKLSTPTLYLIQFNIIILSAPCLPRGLIPSGL